MTAGTETVSSLEYAWIGKSIPKVEDRRLLLGRGQYVDDMVLGGMLHAAVLRSPVAHARITSIDASKARELPGVVAVVTCQEALDLLGPLPDFGPHPDQHVFRAMAADKARFVGEPLAAVVATSRYVAEDARDLIEVDFELLDPISSIEKALAPGAALVHDALGSNIALDSTLAFGDLEGAFAEADHVVKDSFYWGRTGGQPLETVASLADYDPATGILTIHANSVSLTNYHFLLAGVLGLQGNKLNMVPHPAGGSFGSKVWAIRVSIIAGMLSKLVGRPVKYVEDRIDNLSSCDNHGSERFYESVELAIKDGIFTGLKIDVLDDYGAYIQFGVGTNGNAMAQAVGSYRIGALSYRVRGVITNKCQQGAYRGFGSECNNFIVERMVDLAAKELGEDPVELRRRNFIRPEQFPYKIPGGNVYDSGNYEQVLDTAIEMADLQSWRAKQDELRKQGRYIGIGLVTCQERSVYAATEWWFFDKKLDTFVSSVAESITLSVDGQGGVTATLYSTAMWGNAPETMVAQCVAEELGVDPYDVTIVYAGTQGGLPGTGPGGSRFTVMIAGAVAGAAKVLREKAIKVAAHLLEASEDDLEYVDCGVQVKGSPDQRKSLAEIAVMPRMFKHDLPDDITSGFEASHVYDHPYTTMPTADRSDLGVFYPMMAHACHIPIVEVDTETGEVTFLKYVAVHDCGKVINPKSLGGHIVGGLAQGVGQMFLEEYKYDEDGQLLASNYVDYLIPSAMEVPEVDIGHEETPSPFTTYGTKGGGEGGRMQAPAAIACAIDDALAPFGVRVRELPVTPERLLALIDEGRKVS
jgi:CO/xanthine dehydrogenase Mo-binding subunit